MDNETLYLYLTYINDGRVEILGYAEWEEYNENCGTNIGMEKGRYQLWCQLCVAYQQYRGNDEIYNHYQSPYKVIAIEVFVIGAHLLYFLYYSN